MTWNRARNNWNAAYSLYPWLTVALVLTILSLAGQAKYLKDDRLLEDVNLEHYYVIEENVLSHADILLRDDYFGADDDEDEEEHSAHAPNLTDFRRVINETKNVHREAGPDLTSFLSHPINVYHLFRRLSTKWKDGLDLLLETRPCKRWQVSSIAGRLQYLREKLPGDREVARAVTLTGLLQRLHGLSPADVSKGQFGRYSSLQPLTPQEQYQFIQVFRDQEDMASALAWLRQLDDWMVKSGRTGEAELGFNRSQVLTMMASAHFYLKNTKAALKTSQEALKLDPGSVVARSNIEFFKEKLSTAPAQDGDGPEVSKYRSKYERKCSMTERAKLSRHRCRVTRVGLQFINTEVLRRKPLIMLFHDVFPSVTADVIKDYAHKMQTNSAWIGEERYVPPVFRVGIHTKVVRGPAIFAEAHRFQRLLRTLTQILNISSERWGGPQVVNVGLDGVHFSKHAKQLGVVKPVIGESGTFFVFLNDVISGGEIVFRKFGFSAQPSKGSVLFYHTSEQPVHSHCPVLGSSLWVAIQNVYKDARDYCVDDDEWL